MLRKTMWKKLGMMSLAATLCVTLISGPVLAADTGNKSGAVSVSSEAAQATQSTELSLIRNPGFEEALQNGATPSWEQTFGESHYSSFERTDAVKYEGNYSLSLQDDSTDRGFGVESEKFAIRGGDAYSASAMFLVERDTLGIYLQFFNEAGVRIAYSTGWIPVTDGEWVKGVAGGIAPEDAVSASILLYSSVPAQGKGYVDDVRIKHNQLGKFEELGTPITNFIHNTSELGQENGDPVMYAVVKGADDNTVFAVTDVRSAKVVKTIPMPRVEGAWEVETATDGKVYIGTHYDGSLYQYTPGSDQLVNLGRLGEETHVWSLAAGADGKMYAGTYPAGKVFEYDPQSDQITDLGRMHPAEKYVRSLAYSPELNVLYAGVGGTKAHLYKIDLNTGTKEEMLSKLIPEDQDTHPFTYSLGYALGKLFVRVNQPDLLLVVDAATDELEYYDPNVPISMGRNTLAVKPGDDSKIYFGGFRLYSYDLETKSFKDNEYPDNERWASFYDVDFMELDDPEWPGYTMVGATEKGKLLLYNMETGIMERSKVDNYGSPVLVQSVSAGYDGNIYIGGYLGATGFTSFQPETGTYSALQEFGQVESVSSVNDTLYIGTYGHARIHEYDPEQPWTGTNPRRVAELITHNQDRPEALVGVDELGKLYIGTVSDYGTHAGALSVYDTETGAVEVHRGIVEEQGVVSLAYQDGLIYGGTTIYGGLGTSGPIAEEAKLFIFDTETNEKVFEAAPAPGRKVVSGLLAGSDGYIWGVAEDVIFKFDPETREFVYNEPHLGRYTSTGTVWKDAFMVNGIDGNIYGTNKRGHFFMMDPDTMEFVTIQANAGNYLTQDLYGNLYMSSGPYLKRYILPVDEVAVNHFIQQEAEAGRLPHPVRMQLSNGLRQAVHHYDAGRYTEAVKFLNDLLKRLHNEAFADSIPDQTKLPLDQQIRTLIADWESEMAK